MRVTASLQVGRYVREHGGTLYVWFRPVGGKWGTVEVALEAPDAREAQFEKVPAGAFDLYLGSDLAGVSSIAVELTRWPGRRVRVRGFEEIERGGGADGGERRARKWDSEGGVWWGW